MKSVFAGFLLLISGGVCFASDFSPHQALLKSNNDLMYQIHHQRNSIRNMSGFIPSEKFLQAQPVWLCIQDLDKPIKVVSKDLAALSAELNGIVKQNDAVLESLRLYLTLETASSGFVKNNK